ncbi:LysR family transcriptional regulator [Subtercola endophyticus]|uniref:LysR family transcriptional regulator n=1 Tax=Subtercola endophyticus TaxID=2895559 RepID=UPI001E309477|nr:LysR family transcriptional regulator [Subtercola endophyticus]UFS57932.1 LysR family transcriptional regulator [Subtercola endophyticus]
METRQLEYFLAVAEELNFTKAAQSLFAVQSTVSAGIRALETELGATLFERSTRQVALTPVGEALVPEARAVVEAVDRVRGVAVAARSGLRGRLRVGIFTNIEIVDFPGLMSAFARDYPLVELLLTASPSGSSGLAEDVRAGRIDVALMGLPDSELRGLAKVDLVTTEFVAVVPDDHPLAREASVTLQRLSLERFVDTPRGFGNRVVIDREFEARGLSRHVSTEVSDLNAVASFVASGLGVAALPAGLTPPTPGTTVLPLDEPPIEWNLRFVHRSTTRPSPAVAAFLALVREHPVTLVA